MIKKYKWKIRDVNHKERYCTSIIVTKGVIILKLGLIITCETDTYSEPWQTSNVERFAKAASR